MDRLLRDTKGRSKNKKQTRVSIDPQSLHNTHKASQSHTTNKDEDYHMDRLLSFKRYKR